MAMPTTTAIWLMNIATATMITTTATTTQSHQFPSTMPTPMNIRPGNMNTRIPRTYIITMDMMRKT